MRARVFTGLGANIIAFYQALAADNTREWWTAHKAEYDLSVAEPLSALAAELGDEFGTVKVFRPYRDMRFSPDKRPYHEFAHLAAAGPERGFFYLKVSPAGLLLGGGAGQPSPAQLERWRRAVDDPGSAAALLTLLTSLEVGGYKLNEADLLKRAPRGWPGDHPRLELLRHRNLTLGRVFPPEPWWFTGELLDVVREGWGQVGRWNAWLLEHVGPLEHM
jgi:uncharacterized protein (TIGR02453 family)